MIKKKENNNRWKKYFREFFMLFLAVFLGFLADNFLVSVAHNRTEEKYIQSLISDVLVDKHNIKKSIELSKIRMSQYDSLSRISYGYIRNGNTKGMYKYLVMILGKGNLVSFSNRTMAQLKSTGAMRLIKDKESINVIMDYERRKNVILDQGGVYRENHKKLTNLALKLFDFRKFRLITNNNSDEDNAVWNDVKLLQEDKITLMKFANLAYINKSILRYYIYLLKEANKETDTLLKTLRNNYNLE